jgi:hypothetical protein
MYIHTKCLTRCNTSILVLLQDHSTCFGYFPYPSSGVKYLQLTTTVFKPMLPQSSRSNVTYVVPVTVNCSYCTPDDGYGKYSKHVEWSCNKIKILVLHLVGHFVCISITMKVGCHDCIYVRLLCSFLYSNNWTNLHGIWHLGAKLNSIWIHYIFYSNGFNFILVRHYQNWM